MKDRPVKPSRKTRVIVRVQTFGTCTVEVDGSRLGRNADLVTALLLLLTSASGMQMPRDSITALLWPDSPAIRQRGNLRQALYKLRQMGVNASMHGDQVELDATQVHPTFSVRRDAASFHAEVVQGHEPFGPFLVGFDTGENSPFADWVENERERAHADARRVLATALRARHAVADWIAAEPLARWLLQFDPLNEAATLVMAECLVLSGAKYEAIRLLDHYMNELGPGAGDLRIPATTLRRRIAAPAARRISFAPSERHFVGRESVMADLTLCMRRARFHDGNSTLLHGPAGMGKTRVLAELTKVAVIEGIRDVRGGSRETDVTRPLSVFLDLVPELLQMPGALGCSPDGLQALRRFVNDDSVERPIAPGTMQLPLAAGLRRSIVDLLAAVSEEKPVLLVIEDVHWLDAASWEVIVDLVDRIGQMRVCLIMTSRLPHARPLLPERVPLALVVKALQPLSVESSLELAHAIGTDLSAYIDEDLGNWFVHTSEGVPLFLRSLVNHWIETGNAGGIPPTLLGVIGQRMQSLSPDALHVLQSVALLGRHATLTMIESVLELPYFRIVAAIDDLHKAGAFDEDDGGTLVCHELIGRMAVDTLGRNAKRALHRRIAQIMLPVDGNEALSVLACRDRLGHLLLSGDTKAFLAASLETIRGLLNAGYSYDALGVSGAALEHAVDEGIRSRVLALQAEALYSCGEYSKLLTHPLSPASVGHGLSHWEREEPEALLRWIDSAAYADRGTSASELAAAATLVAEAERYARSTRFTAATLAIRLAANAAADGLALRAYVVGQQMMDGLTNAKDRLDELDMLFHTSFGDSERATVAAERLLVASNSIQSVTERLQLRIRIAFSLRYCGKIETAKDLLCRIHADALTENLGSTFYFAPWRLSHLYLDIGDTDAAERWFHEFERLAPIDREPLAAMLYHTHGMRMALARSNLQSARFHHVRAQESLPERGHLMRYAAAVANRLGIARLGGDHSEIEATLKEAISVFEKSRKMLGQSFLAAEIALGLAQVGRVPEGKQLLEEFIGTYRREPQPMPRFLGAAASELGLRLSDG